MKIKFLSTLFTEFRIFSKSLIVIFGLLFSTFPSYSASDSDNCQLVDDWSLMHYTKNEGKSTVLKSGFTSAQETLDYFNSIQQYNISYYFVKGQEEYTRRDFTRSPNGEYPLFVYYSANAKKVCAAFIEGEEELGDFCSKEHDHLNQPLSKGKGCPSWHVNPKNINIYGYDVPLWYSTPYGADVVFKLSYNSKYTDAMDTYERTPFGYKWMLSYGSFLQQDDAGDIIAVMPDGEHLYFKVETDGSFARSYKTAAVLSSVGDDYAISLQTGGVYHYQASPKEDSRYRLTTIDDAQGHSLSLSYDDDGQLVSIADAQGQVSRLVYNAEGLVTEIVDAFGRKATFAYDGSENLVSITDMAGYRSELFYDGEHLLTRVEKPQGSWLFKTEDNDDLITLTLTDPQNGSSEYRQETATSSVLVSPENYGTANKTTFSYTGEEKDLSRITYADGSYRTFTYDDEGFVTGMTDENGISEELSYNGSQQITDERRGNRSVATDYLNATISLPTTITRAGANGQPLTTTYEYSNNLPITVSVSDGSTTRTTRYQYNANGQVTQIDGPRTDVNDVVTFTYHGCDDINYCNRLATMTNALGEVTTFSDYQSGGLVGKITQPNGLARIYRYDGLQHVISVKEQDGLTDLGTTRFEYHFPQQGPSKIIFADGSTITQSYDANNRLMSSIDAVGNRINYTRDADGKITARSVVDSSGNLNDRIAYQYDIRNRVSQVLNNSGIAKASYEYDPAGNLTRMTDALGYADQQNYNDFNELTKTTDANSGQTIYTYTTGGAIASVTDAEGRTTNYTYNGFGEVLNISSPDSGATTYTYDSAGNALSQTDARGITTQYAYDALNRLVSISYPNKKENVTYRYSKATKRRVTVKDADGKSIYRYNGRGQLLKHIRRQGGKKYITAYSYNKLGRLLRVSYPSGLKIRYHYHSNGDVRSIRQVSPTRQVLAKRIEYRATGAVSGLVYGNGRGQTRVYDQDNRLTDIIYPDTSSKYRYTARDNLGTILQDGQSETFTYDALGRLITASGGYGQHSYTFDGIGNRLSEQKDNLTNSYLYNAQKQLIEVKQTGNTVTVPTLALDYDAAGNITQKGDLTLAYNQANRLATAEKGTMNATYRYNADGVRSSKTVNGSRTDYLYSGSRLLAWRDAQGWHDNIYLNGEILATVDNGTIHYHENDYQGKALRLVNEQGNTVWNGDWQPYRESDNPQNGINNPQRFAGQILDEETGLYYNHFREYDPQTGRYTQSDPIGLNGGVNTYAYVGGNPVNFVDPLGTLTVNISNLSGDWYTVRTYSPLTNQPEREDKSKEAAGKNAMKRAIKKIPLGGPAHKLSQLTDKISEIGSITILPISCDSYSWRERRDLDKVVIKAFWNGQEITHEKVIKGLDAVREHFERAYEAAPDYMNESFGTIDELMNEVEKAKAKNLFN